MTKLALAFLVVATLVRSSAAAPSVSDGFENTFPATGWSRQNLSSSLGSNPNWDQYTQQAVTAHSGTKFVMADYLSVGPNGTISNWLFTPAVTIANGVILRFWTKSEGGGSFADRLEVRMSTAGASVNAGASSSSVGDFTGLLLEINQALTPTGYPTAWTEYVVTVTGVPVATTGRFAFRYFVTNSGPGGTNGAAVVLDDVEISSLCGDGSIITGEACDDGNAVNGDGCDSNCTVSACGNTIVAGTEVCDDGNAVNGDGCDSNCTVSACGNTIVAGTEVCDDGNVANGDGCDSNCTVSACGNTIVAGTEVCDDGNVANGDGCDSNCTVSACGNTIVAGTEVCDDGNVANGDGCDSNCTVSACGNAVVAGAEVCDDGNLANGDGCDSNCTATACGNAVVTSGEDCDDGNASNDDACANDCTQVIAGQCGNGVIDDEEQCDDDNLSGGDGCSRSCQVEAGYTCRFEGRSRCSAPVGGCEVGPVNEGRGVRGGILVMLGLVGLDVLRRRRARKSEIVERAR